VTLDASLLALSGRIRLREGCTRSAEDVVTELWARHLGAPDAGDGGEDPGAGDSEGAGAGKA
jgi:MoxR-like ATPase